MRLRGTVLLAVVLLLGCAGDPAGRAADPGSPAPQPPVSARYAGDDCPGTHPYRLDLWTDLAVGVPVLDGMTACTGARAGTLWLRNDSGAVWTLQLPAGTAVRRPAVLWPVAEARLRSFTEVAAAMYRGTVVSLPGSVLVVDAPPVYVSWTLHPDLSAAFVVHGRVAAAVAGQGRTYLDEALTWRGSPRRAALSTCTAEAGRITGQLGRGLAGPDPAGTLLTELGVASGDRECGGALAAVADPAGRAPGVTPTWVTVSRVLTDADAGLRRDNLRLRALSALGRVSSYALPG